jgi:hypothetical protein
MKKSAIGSGIAVVVIIGIVVVLTSTPQDNRNGLEMPVEEPNISDSANVSTGAEFIIDEEGNKVFVISVGDKPEFGD